jgi:GT2 family glycosyltransferase
MRASQISLIIATYQRPEALEQELEGVSIQTEWPGEIIIADDGSGPAIRSVIEKWKSMLPVTIRHLWHEDLGFRKTVILNKALATVTTDYLVLLDADCVPHPQFIADHAELAEKGFWVQGRRCFVKEPFAAEFSVKTCSPYSWMLRGRISGMAKGVRLPFPLVLRNMKQRGIIGCNMGLWREDLFAVNGFDEEYVGWGIAEDSDVGTRLYNLGRPRKFVYGRAIVYHLNHPVGPRPHFEASQARLRETIQSKKVRCAKGLAQYLTAGKELRA